MTTWTTRLLFGAGTPFAQGGDLCPGSVGSPGAHRARLGGTRRGTGRALIAAGVAAALMVPVAGPASADPVVSAPLVEGLSGPLGLAVGSDGTVYVSQSFAGRLTQVTRKGGVSDIVTPENLADGASVYGVAADGRGTVSFTESGEGEVTGDYTGFVKRVLPNGKIKTVGDTGTFEETYNPDQINTYGFLDLDPECAAQMDAVIPGSGASYPGAVDSNSYSVAIVGGSRIVADAAGNDIVRVSPKGTVSLVAVLPPIPVTTTKEAVDEVEVLYGIDLPQCIVGEVANYEPVPTDVELGPDGMLYVSSLGESSNGSGGGIGAVFKVNPRTGSVTKIASGFNEATDLAVAPDGTIYVTELVQDRISKVVNGGPQKVVDLDSPAAVEYANGTLYATTGTFAADFEPGNGAVVTITL